jgi:hypothetical protein
MNVSLLLFPLLFVSSSSHYNLHISLSFSPHHNAPRKETAFFSIAPRSTVFF